MRAKLRNNEVLKAKFVIEINNNFTSSLLCYAPTLTLTNCVTKPCCLVNSTQTRFKVS